MGIVAIILIYQVLICSFCVANVTFDYFKRNNDVDGMIRTVGILDLSDTASRSLATCASACSVQPACKGVFFSGVQSLCTGSTERNFDTSNMVASTETIYFAKSAKHLESCSSDADCLLPNQACQIQNCRCIVGYPHDPTSHRCVTECTEYGTTFQSYESSRLNIPCPLSVQNLSYAEYGACWELCVSHSWCRSFDHSRGFYTCKLYGSTDPDAFEPNNYYYHYERDCAQP